MNQTDLNVPALEIKDLIAGYKRTTALKDVTFQAPQGEIVGIIGPNGAGKSTLFKAVLGLLKPWSGESLIFGHPSHTQQSLIGYMPQIELVDWNFPVSVSDVVLMGRYSHIGMFMRPSKTDLAATDDALERVSMTHLKNRLIGELSGGQRRLTLLARALASHPKLLLLDEPMAGLDANAQHQFISILRSLRSEGTSIVLSTHDLSCVSAACDLTLCLNCHVVAYGPPNEVLVEEILGKTFGTHLLMVHLDGQAYAYQHHRHNTEIGREPK